MVAVGRAARAARLSAWRPRRHAVHARRTPHGPPHGARRTADAAAARDHAARRPRPPQSRRSAGTRLTVAGSQTLIYFYYPFVKLRFFRTESHAARCSGRTRPRCRRTVAVGRAARLSHAARRTPHAARRTRPRRDRAAAASESGMFRLGVHYKSPRLKEGMCHVMCQGPHHPQGPHPTGPTTALN